MKCPVCGNSDTKVVDSRLTGEGYAIRRRRECERCRFRFSTYEQMEILDLIVIKKDGKREPYSREKLKQGLKRSLEKRPVTVKQFHKLIAQIERSIQKQRKNEISSLEIGEIVMKHLKKLDKVAYIRFASVYRAFEDLDIFQQELSQLLAKNGKKTSPKNKK